MSWVGWSGTLHETVSDTAMRRIPDSSCRFLRVGEMGVINGSMLVPLRRCPECLDGVDVYKSGIKKPIVILSFHCLYDRTRLAI